MLNAVVDQTLQIIAVPLLYGIVVGFFPELSHDYRNSGDIGLVLSIGVVVTAEDISQPGTRGGSDGGFSLRKQLLYLMSTEYRPLTLREVDESSVNQHRTGQQKTDSDDKGDGGFEAARHGPLAANRYSPKKPRRRHERRRKEIGCSRS